MIHHDPLLLSSSPHFFSNTNVSRLMLNVIIALLPTTIYGIYLFRGSALTVVLTSVISCVVFEVLFRLVTGSRQNFRDLSAVVTGLLLALVLPPGTPWWMVVIGAFLAIVIAKEFFGGLGMNPFNPALIGRAILLMSFPAAMTSWHNPFNVAGAVSSATFVDATTSATPLGILKMGGSLMDVAGSIGLGSMQDLYMALFLGNRGGCIGECSILLIALGGIFLIATKTIVFVVPVVMLAATALFTAIFGGDPLFGVLSGGVAFGAFFMATDYVTTPLTTWGKVLFAIGAALIIVLIRRFGGYPEGVTYGILIMNAITPYLNKIREKKYGYVKGAKK